MKTVRFTHVVERSGRPHVHTLWVAPDKDPELTRARRAHHVMTIEQGRGKTDTGRVGFDPDRDETSQILIFPKSLEPFEGARVVGIKFDLIEQPKLVPATPSKTRRAPPKRTREKSKAGSKSKRQSAAPRPEPKHVREKAEEHRPEPPAPKRASQRQRPPSKVIKFPRTAAKPKRQSPLAREIISALKELEAGHSAAAYRRLQRAIEDEE